MSNLGERIKYVRSVILKINQSTFAEKLGFSRVPTISDYEKDKRSPDVDTLRKIACLGGVTIDWLLTGEAPAPFYDTPVPVPLEAGDTRDTAYSADVVKVDVFGMAAAGNANEFPAGEPVDTVYVRAGDRNKDLVAIRFEGEAMSPTVLDGAVVGIDTSKRHLVSGRLYAVWLRHEGVTIKRVFVYPDRIVLKPDNPLFPETEVPAEVKGEDFIIGGVRWVFQRY